MKAAAARVALETGLGPQARNAGFILSLVALCNLTHTCITTMQILLIKYKEGIKRPGIPHPLPTSVQGQTGLSLALPAAENLELDQLGSS